MHGAVYSKWYCRTHSVSFSQTIAHIRGRNFIWPAQIDDISVWSPPSCSCLMFKCIMTTSTLLSSSTLFTSEGIPWWFYVTEEGYYTVAEWSVISYFVCLWQFRRTLAGLYFFVDFSGGLGCVGHSFAYVAHFEFLGDVWIQTQRAAVASRCATNLTHPSP